VLRVDAEAGEEERRPELRALLQREVPLRVGAEAREGGAEPQRDGDHRPGGGAVDRDEPVAGRDPEREPAHLAGGRVDAAAGERHLERRPEEPGQRPPAPPVARQDPAPGGVVAERAREHPRGLAEARALERDDVRRQAALISRILNLSAPRGAETSTTSPFLWPM